MPPAPDPAAPSRDDKPSGAEKNVTKDSSLLENSKNKSAADESSSSTPSRPGNDSADSGGSGASETPGKPNISRRSRISVLFRSFLERAEEGDPQCQRDEASAPVEKGRRQRR